MKDFLDPSNTNLTSTNPIGLNEEVLVKMNGVLLTFSNNTVSNGGAYNLDVSNTPWANSYTWTLSAGASAYLYPSGNGKTANLYVTGSGSFNIYVTSFGGYGCSKGRYYYFSTSSYYSNYQIELNSEAQELSIVKNVDANSSKDDIETEIILQNTLSTRRISKCHNFSSINRLNISISDFQNGIYIVYLKDRDELIQMKRVLITN